MTEEAVIYHLTGGVDDQFDGDFQGFTTDIIYKN